MKLIDVQHKPSASRKWAIHFCGAPWDEDRKIAPEGWPLRIHVNTPWFHFATALTRNSTFARLRDGKIESSIMWLSIRER